MKRALDVSGLSALHDRLTGWFARHRGMSGFDALGPRAAERLVQDVGHAMSDMAAIARPHAGSDVLLPQRLEAIGIDPAYLQATERATFREMEIACARCTNWRRCARDLARGDVQVGLDSYCLNADTIDDALLGDVRRGCVEGSGTH